MSDFLDILIALAKGLGAPYFMLAAPIAFARDDLE
jgi:hypothetical protein